MSDFKLPELPSDDELGITDEDRENLEAAEADEKPELSPQELLALLDESPREKKGSAPKKEGTKGSPSAGVRQEAAGPRSRLRGPVTLALLVAVSVVSSSRTGLPRPVAANAPDTAFSSARALTALTDIARLPRPMGSPEHARVRQLLIDRLGALGLEPEVQTATALAQVTGAARATTVRNILARIPGSAPTGAVLLTAHYDSRELSPGAADDGAGLVTILETIRAIQAGPTLRNDVMVLFTDAEEVCLCGARAFVDQHPWIDDVSVVLSFEMRGAAGSSLMFETKERNGWIVRALTAAEPPPYANSLAYEVYQRMPNETDFTEFKRAGKQGLNFAVLDGASVYHQATDRPDNLSEATLQHHGGSALAMTRYLGDADLASVDDDDVVYFNAPGLGLVVYDSAWVVPISGGLLALALIAWLAVRAAGGRVYGILASVGVAVLGGALSFGLALWMRTWIFGFYPEAGSLSGSILHSEGWWVLAVAAGTFAIVTTAHGIARQWLGVGELALGAAVVPLVLALVASFLFSLGAMNLQWPVAAALVAIVLVGLLRKLASGAFAWIAAVALAVPVLALLVPIVELVWLAMTVSLIAPLAVLMALTLHLCLPALDALRHPNSWWAPVTGLLVAGLSFGLAIRTASPNAERPAPSTLVYAYAHGTGSALWATDPAADIILDEAAIEWATLATRSGFAETRDMSDFGYPAVPMPVAAAPLVEAARPEVRVLSDSIDGAVRNVQLAVRSILGAELLRFQRDSSGSTTLLGINGASIEDPEALEWAEHYGEPDSAGVVLELRMPATEPIGLLVIEHHFRPRELLGPSAFERPEHLTPDVSTMSDRAVFSYSVGAFADPRHAFMPGATDAESVVPATGTPPDPVGSPVDSASARPDSAGTPSDSTTAPPDSGR